MASNSATPEDVRRLAALSRIAIPDADIERFASEFDSVLAYVGKLDELTLATGSDRTLPTVRNVLREDGEPHAAGKFTEKIAAQFPQRHEDYLSVKQIISHD